MAGGATKIIDLKGRRVVPGFNDAHVHFFLGGRGLASVQLRDAKSKEEFQNRIAAFARESPRGRWILEGNWDHENWSPAELPSRSWIDAVTPDNPVFVQRLDGHMALANSAALKLAGITRETKDPPGGVIVRDASGEPTGILKDAAKDAVNHLIPAPSSAEIEEALLAAMSYAASQGVTSVQDMSATPDELRSYQSLARSGRLTVRVSAHLPLSEWHRLADLGVQAGLGSDLIKVGALKGFADGSLGSTTGWFYEPYVDAPGTVGLPSAEMTDEKAMQERITAADRAGLHIAIHAIGDRANDRVLAMFAETEKINGPRDRRFRIEHVQHLRPDAFKTFSAQHVIASTQPYHAIDDGRWAEKRIGPERIKRSYAFKSLLDAGVTLAFGSDWFVAPMEPLMGIYAAATRRTLDGKNPGGWVPEQKITVAQALRAYTYGSAYASSDENVKGTLAPGYLADFVVLSQDIAIDPVEISRTRVDMTVFGGEVVYER